jgi:putative ubiquitin-RnfH superfamily antitoxin RatB of RatAB toxin-antitoxin module
MAAVELLEIEIAYVNGRIQYLSGLRVPYGTTLRGAIERSRIGERFPEINFHTWKIGVFGELRRPEETVSEGDRVEIYPPLRCDPKDARRRRAAGLPGRERRAP